MSRSSIAKHIPFVMVIVLLCAIAVQPVAVAAPHATPASALRISQVYGGGGNSGAPLTHDFIEIFNSSSAAVSLNGLFLQYASATGTGNFGSSTTMLTELSDVLLQPGQYFLVQEAGGATGVPLPTPDSIDATGGKVVLVSGVTSLGCNGGSMVCNAEQVARIIKVSMFKSPNNRRVRVVASFDNPDLQGEPFLLTSNRKDRERTHIMLTYNDRWPTETFNEDVEGRRGFEDYQLHKAPRYQASLVLGLRRVFSSR